MNGVPRTANGWPTIEPSEFTDIQLVAEAMSWRATAMHTHPGTVGGSLWVKYCSELVKRGLMSEMHIDAYPDLTLLDWVQPHLVKPKAPPVKRPWWRLWS